jgi:hypothetical protein
MNQIFVLLAGLLVSATPSQAQDEATRGLAEGVSDSSLHTTLQVISGPEFEGRMAAGRGDGLAVQYIAHRFGAYHLVKPFNTPNPYLQAVPLRKVEFQTTPCYVNDRAYEVDKEWTYFLSAKTLVAQNAEIVFVGYGLSLPMYDDLKDVDVRGKMLLMSPGVPTDKTGKPLIPESQTPDDSTILGTLFSKQPQV